MDKQIITKRLSYIKYLYNKGVEQSKQNGILAGFSLMQFHDAVEMFLLLVSEEKNIKAPNSLMDFWNIIKPEPTLKESIKAMKNRRVSLKHQGAFPSHEDIIECQINTKTFLEENTPIYFSNIDFRDISLLDLISYSEVKEFLECANNKLKQNKYYECLIEARKGFDKLLKDYEGNKEYWFNSIFSIGRDPRNTYKEPIKQINPKKYDYNIAWFKDVNETIKDLRTVTKLTSIGIDYKRYALFNTVAPHATLMTDGKYYIKEGEEYFKSKIKASSELCEICIDFVIDCAVKLQNSDYDISKYVISPENFHSPLNL